MRVIVCGSRYWTDERPIAERLGLLDTAHIIIHGGCRGADIIAGRVAKQLGFWVESYPADWKLGKAGGPIRNQQMLDAGADLVLAFTPDIITSRGTADMVRRARKAGVPVEIIGEVRR